MSAALSFLRNADANLILRNFPDGAIVIFDADLRYVCAGFEIPLEVSLPVVGIRGSTMTTSHS
jgi:hypothetical protein